MEKLLVQTFSRFLPWTSKEQVKNIFYTSGELTYSSEWGVFWLLRRRWKRRAYLRGEAKHQRD